MPTPSDPNRPLDASSESPANDPEHKTGRHEPAEIARDAERQRDGAAVHSSEINANVPRPNDERKSLPRDPAIEGQVPGA